MQEGRYGEAIDLLNKYIASNRHDGLSNYLFVDGHAESLPVEDTYNVKGRCLWFPQSAPRWPDWAIR